MPFFYSHVPFHIFHAFSYFKFCVSFPLNQTPNVPFPLKTYHSVFGNLFLNKAPWLIHWMVPLPSCFPEFWLLFKTSTFLHCFLSFKYILSFDNSKWVRRTFQLKYKIVAETLKPLKLLLWPQVNLSKATGIQFYSSSLFSMKPIWEMKGYTHIMLF